MRDKANAEQLRRSLQQRFAEVPGRLAFVTKGSIFSGNSSGSRAIELDIAKREVIAPLLQNPTLAENVSIAISGGLGGLWLMNEVVGIRMPLDLLTMLGMIVLIGTELYRGLGTIVLFGLFFSILLTLSFIPALLMLLFDAQRYWRQRR